MSNITSGNGRDTQTSSDLVTMADRVFAEASEQDIEAEEGWPDSQGERIPDERPSVEFQVITCAELDAAEYRLEYLIDGALVAGQPCVIAGGKKMLKTSLLIDLGISLATGGYFLGKMRVNRSARVGIMTGESGMATIQETARRIASAARVNLADIEDLVFCEDLPQFGDVLHMNALRGMIETQRLEVVAIDPAYLCMPSDDVSNLFAQGRLLRSMNKVCDDTGATMLLCHHTRKAGKVDPYEPPELEDIAWAGFQEWCRQWLLVGRREKYEPGSGEHALWLSSGGSAGHSGLWAVNVSEGVREPGSERYWDVEVLRAEEAREAARDAGETRKRDEQTRRQQEQLQADMGAILLAMRKLRADTKSRLRDASGVRTGRFDVAIAELIQGGSVVPVEITKPNRKTPYEGYELAND